MLQLMNINAYPKITVTILFSATFLTSFMLLAFQQAFAEESISQIGIKCIGTTEIPIPSDENKSIKEVFSKIIIMDEKNKLIKSEDKTILADECTKWTKTTIDCVRKDKLFFRVIKINRISATMTYAEGILINNLPVAGSVSKAKCERVSLKPQF